MAEVFLAKAADPESSTRLLAVKRMLPRLSSEQDFVSMFDDEARIASALSHANICRIYDQGQVDRQLFIAMEFIHGKDLRIVHRRALDRGEPIPPRFAAFIVAKIARALDYAHAKTNDRGESEHIVHRDVSPQNILISYDGVAKLIDFGIAKARDRIATTRVGIVKGKSAYMSPEQARGEAVDGRSDLFALGVVLYQLLADRLPFRGSGDMSTLKKIARAEYEPIETINGDVPRRLVAAVTKALARDPSGRYQDGGDMAADLELYLADERRDVTEASLSSYMRKLFRDDYIREMARIKRFRAFTPPAATPREPTAMGDGRPETADVAPAGAHAEPTRVEPIDERLFDKQSLSLAAGYDGTASDLDDLEIDIDVMVDPIDSSAELVAATGDEDPGLSDGSFADFDVDHADQPETLAMSSPPPSTDSGVRDRDLVSPARPNLPATPGRPRSKRRLLTEMETAILVFVAALGVAAVVGAYWYATTMEFESDDMRAARLAPESAPVSPEASDRTP